MNRSRNTSNVKIPYRDGKIAKELSLNLDNEHDARFFESYHKIPLDNRNYLASLYAREQENGVNDDVGHRLQDLALINPKEDDPAFMREKRNAELESLNESIKAYDRMIKKIKDDAMGQPNATEKAEIAELEKKRDELKRKVRNINSSVTKVLNSAIFRTGHLSGISPLTKDALKESLNTVADALNKDVVAFLEDRFEKLSSKDDGESGSEQFVTTNAAYLAAMCQYLGIENVSKISDAIKRFYALLQAIKNDTLTDAAYAANYAGYVDDIIDLLKEIDDVEVPDFFNKGKADVIVEQMKPIASSIKFALGRAAYKTYNEADKRHMPNWNDIKNTLDGSSFMQLYAIGNEVSTFRDTTRFKKADHPYKLLSNAIRDAVENIYDSWQDVPAVRVKTQHNKSYRQFMMKINELEDINFVGRASYTRKGNVRSYPHDVVELTTEFNLADNTLKVTVFKAIDTKFEEALHGIEFPDWLHIPDYDKARYTYVYQPPAIEKDTFVSTVTNAILSQLHIEDEKDLPSDVMRRLVSKSAGAQYRALDAPESEFHNIIDMGNPLKEIRSRYRR